MLTYLLPTVAALAFFVWLELRAGMKPRKPTPLWLGLLTVPASVAVYVGGGFLIAPYIGLAIALMINDSSHQTLQLIAVLSFIGGIWISATVLQFAQNAVRLAQGRRWQPIRWIDNPFKISGPAD